MEQQLNSLQAIEEHRQELRKQMTESEKEIKQKWDNIFHKKTSPPSTPTQKFLSMASTGTGLIDGIILGWKLYRKFKK